MTQANPMPPMMNPFTNGAKSPEQVAHEKIMEDLHRQLDQKTLEVFNNPHGDVLLDAWDDFYIRQPVFRPGDVPGSTEMREGRNAFIRYIRTTVQRARAGK